MDATIVAGFLAAMLVGALAGALTVRALTTARRVVADAERDLQLTRGLDVAWVDPRPGQRLVAPGR